MDILRNHKTVTIDYTNWKGERRERTIIPINMYFGETKFHPGFQWLLDAYDLESRRKCFAMKDIHSWTPFTGESNE